MYIGGGGTRGGLSDGWPVLRPSSGLAQDCVRVPPSAHRQGKRASGEGSTGKMAVYGNRTFVHVCVQQNPNFATQGRPPSPDGTWFILYV